VTAVEAYELTTKGGATDFARLIEACKSFGPYCLIGGLAVNCYVEPVYTLDADIVVNASGLSELSGPGAAKRTSNSSSRRTKDSRRTLPAASYGPMAIHYDGLANARRTNWT
jgi:hypothetical protein